jgi:hypothetical protein
MAKPEMSICYGNLGGSLAQSYAKARQGKTAPKSPQKNNKSGGRNTVGRKPAFFLGAKPVVRGQGRFPNFRLSGRHLPSSPRRGFGYGLAAPCPPCTLQAICALTRAAIR